LSSSGQKEKRSIVQGPEAKTRTVPLLLLQNPGSKRPIPADLRGWDGTQRGSERYLGPCNASRAFDWFYCCYQVPNGIAYSEFGNNAL